MRVTVWCLVLLTWTSCRGLSIDQTTSASTPHSTATTAESTVEKSASTTFNVTPSMTSVSASPTELSETAVSSERVPDPPASHVTNTSLTTEWPEVTLPNAQYVTYLVSWQLEPTHGINQPLSVTGQNQTQISPGQTDTDYLIHAREQITTIMGEKQTLTLDFSPLAVQTVPDTPTHLMCSSPGQTKLHVTWKISGNLTDPVTYHFQMLESNALVDDSNGSQEVLGMSIDDTGELVSTSMRVSWGQVSDNRVAVDRLKDFWLYTFNMWVSTTAGQSEILYLGTCRTQSSAPGPVRGLRVTSLNSTAAEVRWTCPQESDQHGQIVGFQLTQTPVKWSRTDLSDELRTVTTWVRSTSWPCTSEFIQIVTVLAEVTYNFTIQGRVKSIDELGAAVSQRFISQASAPPPILTPPTSPSINDSSTLKESSFSTRICVSCLTDNRNGQIRTFGVLVCQEGFCDQNLDSLSWRDMLNTGQMPNWNVARSRHFKMTYRATDQVWENRRMGNTGSWRQASDVIFDVGNDPTCADRPASDYCNNPLPSGKIFRVRLFSCTDAGCTFSQTSQPFMTAEPVPDPSSDSVMVVAAVGSAVGVFLLMVVIVMVLRMSFRKTKKETFHKEAGGPRHNIALSDMNIDRKKSRDRWLRFQGP